MYNILLTYVVFGHYIKYNINTLICIKWLYILCHYGYTYRFTVVIPSVSQLSPEYPWKHTQLQVPPEFSTYP